MARSPLNIIGQSIVNKVINGNFDFWQRGTSFSTPAANTYTADRMRVAYDGSIGTFTVSQQAFTAGQTQVPNNPTYFLRWNQTAAGSGSTFRRVQHFIEDVNTYSGQTVTVSFWAKADAARTMNVRLSQAFGSGGSSNVDQDSANLSLTTSWQKFTATFALASVSGKTVGANHALLIQLLLPINTTMTIDIAQVCLNQGSAPMAFRRAGGDLGGELALCQRYYQKTYLQIYQPGTNNAQGCLLLFKYNSDFCEGATRFPVVMRTAPTMTFYATDGTANAVTIPGIGNLSGVSADALGDQGFSGITKSGAFSGAQAVQFHYTVDAEF